MTNVIDAEEMIKSQNADLYTIVAKNIESVPDPRSMSVQKSYEETWTTTVAWKRLLHELTAIGIDENDALLLEAIQNNTLADEHHLAERLKVWVMNYPMITWTISLTNPTARRYIAVAVGDPHLISTITAKQITSELIDHIRDSKTALILRGMKGGTARVSDTFKTLQSSLRKEKFGKVWWIVTGIDLKNVDSRNLAYELWYVFTHHEDDEITWSIIEIPTVVSSKSFIEFNSNYSIHTPTKNFDRLLRVMWDDYLLTSTNSLNEDVSPPMFVHIVWNSNAITYLYIDEEFALYMMKTYLDKVNGTTILENSEDFFLGFIHPSYYKVLREIIPYIDVLWKYNDVEIGEIAIMAHNDGIDDIADSYAKVFVKNYDPKINNQNIVELVGRRDGFSWLYDQLSIEQQHALLYGVTLLVRKGEKTIIEESNYGASLPAVYYDTILDGKVNEAWIQYTLPYIIDYNLRLNNPDITRLTTMIQILYKHNIKIIYNLVKNHKTAGALFLSIVPKDIIQDKIEQHWWGYISKETLRALIEIVGYPSTTNFKYLMTHFNKDFLVEIPHEKLIEYVNDGGFDKLDYEEKLKIAKKYNLKGTKLFGEKFLERFLRKDFYRAHIADIKDILLFASNDVSWNDLLRDIRIYGHRDTHEIIKILLAQGADPSSYSSQALIQELAIRRRSSIIKLLVTPKALRNLTPTARVEVQNILAKD